MQTPTADQEDTASVTGAPRLAEVVAALSLATDLGLGQPMQHGLRSCLIACGIAEALDLDDDLRDATYWVALLAMAGCTGESSEMSAAFGDDIAFRRGLYDVGPSAMGVPRYFLAKAGADAGLVRRTRLRAELIATRMDAVMTGFVADCRIAAEFADRLGLGSSVSDPLRHRFARWDGKGIPAKLGGEQIAVAARVLAISYRAESEYTSHGEAAAAAWLENHAGHTLDPRIVEVAVAALPGILDGLEDDCWEAVVATAPPRAPLSGPAYVEALEALGDFAEDRKSVV